MKASAKSMTRQAELPRESDSPLSLSNSHSGEQGWLPLEAVPVQSIDVRPTLEDGLFLETLMNTAPVGLAFMDRELRFRRINKCLAAINGASVDEHLGRTLREVLPELASTLEPIHWNVLETGESVVNVQIFGETKAQPGRRRSWLASYYPVRPGRGEAIGVGVVVLETTERHRAEEAYRSIFENAVYGIYRSTNEGHLIDVNPAMVSMLGYTDADELKKLNLNRDIYREYVAREVVAKDLESDGSSKEAVVEWKRKDGRTITVRLSLRNVPDEPGVFEGIVEDVTERRLLEEQHRQAQKMESIGRLAGGIAHDFNNLLTAILGYSEVILLSLEPHEALRAKIETIRTTAEKAAALTRQLLAFSRKEPVQPAIIDLNSMLAESGKILSRLIPANVQMTTTLDSRLRKIYADRSQMEQVIMNLVLNARDAMPHGGELSIQSRNVVITQNAGLPHQLLEPGSYVLLSVSDSGCGIDEETRQHLFEPFFTKKPFGQGTGLGLATVYSIVQRMEGQIRVDSSPGRGTTFEVYLPATASDCFTDKEESIDQSPCGSETILVVEDEDVVRHLVVEVLKEHGYRLLVAADGYEGLSVYEQNQGSIDLVITDMVMPRMSGRDLAQRLLSVHHHVKILYMSGYTDQNIAPFIQKPFKSALLLHKVREILDSVNSTGCRSFHS
jgi:two-component system, cell cycle sensor histidine kinase and response regulator CckA